MASKKSSQVRKVARRDAAKELKDLNLLPKNYRINQLSEGQWRHVRRIRQKLKEKFSELAPKPETYQFHPERYLTGKVSSADAKRLAEKGYVVRRTSKGWFFFGERQHANKIRFSPRDKSITREFGNRINKTYPYDDSPQTLARIKSFFENKKKLDFLTLRIGDKSPFNRALNSWAEFNKYINKIEEEWKARASDPDPLKRRDNPFGELQIVEVRVNGESKTRKATAARNTKTSSGKKRRASTKKK